MAQSCLFILSPLYGLSVCVPLKPVGGAVVKNLPANAGDARKVDSVPGLGRSPRVGNGNPFHSFCVENPVDRGAWRATVHGVAKSQT